jgi:hypothetical protein
MNGRAFAVAEGAPFPEGPPESSGGSFWLRGVGFEETRGR